MRASVLVRLSLGHRGRNIRSLVPMLLGGLLSAAVLQGAAAGSTALERGNKRADERDGVSENTATRSVQRQSRTVDTPDGILTVTEWAGKPGSRTGISGLDPLPPVGTVLVSPALARSLRAEPDGEIAAWFEAQAAVELPRQLLASPDELVGLTISAQKAAPGNRVSGDNERTQTRSLLFLIIGILQLPAMGVLALATRLSVARRMRRFALLRLIGLRSSTITKIILCEWAAVMMLANLAVLAGLSLLSESSLSASIADSSFFLSDARPSPGIALLSLTASFAVAGFGSLLALRRLTVDPLGVARRQPSERARSWVLLLLPVGISLVYVGGRIAVEDSGAARGLIILSGLTIGILGLFAATRLTTSLCGRLLLRRSQTTVAAARLARAPRDSSAIALAAAVAVFAFLFVRTAEFTLGHRQDAHRRIWERSLIFAVVPPRMSHLSKQFGVFRVSSESRYLHGVSESPMSTRQPALYTSPHARILSTSPGSNHRIVWLAPPTPPEMSKRR